MDGDIKMEMFGTTRRIKDAGPGPSRVAEVIEALEYIRDSVGEPRDYRAENGVIADLFHASSDYVLVFNWNNRDAVNMMVELWLLRQTDADGNPICLTREDFLDAHAVIDADKTHYTFDQETQDKVVAECNRIMAELAQRSVRARAELTRRQQEVEYRKMRAMDGVESWCTTRVWESDDDKDVHEYRHEITYHGQNYTLWEIDRLDAGAYVCFEGDVQPTTNADTRYVYNLVRRYGMAAKHAFGMRM